MSCAPCGRPQPTYKPTTTEVDRSKNSQGYGDWGLGSNGFGMSLGGGLHYNPSNTSNPIGIGF